MVEEQFGFELADEVIESSDLPSGGAYTSVGTYDHRELQALVVNLARLTGKPAPELLHDFGGHLLQDAASRPRAAGAGILQRSSFAALAEGLLLAAARHFRTLIRLDRDDQSDADGSLVAFTLEREAAFP